MDKFLKIVAKQIRMIIFLSVLPALIFGIFFWILNRESCPEGNLLDFDQKTHKHYCYNTSDKSNYIRVEQECANNFPKTETYIYRSLPQEDNYSICIAQYGRVDYTDSDLPRYGTRSSNLAREYNLDVVYIVSILFPYPIYLIFLLLRWAFKNK